MGVSPADRSDGGGGISGGGYLRLLLQEHSRTVHCDHAHYGPVYVRGEAYGVTGGQVVVASVRLGLGRGVEDEFGGGMGGTGGGVEDMDRTAT